MGKFIIQDLLIEKSEKDIQTGKKYLAKNNGAVWF